MQGEGWEELVLFIIVDLDFEMIKISQIDVDTEVSIELGSNEDLAFILDEHIHSYTQNQKLKKPSAKTGVKLYVSLSKSEKSKPLLTSFNASSITYIAETFYDIYLLHDCDSSVLYMALNV